jgi:SPP1 family predicted phage head-tail adaptor
MPKFSTIRSTAAITASDLGSRITIQQRQSGIDAAGQESLTWVDWATVWASVKRVRAADYSAAAQEQAMGVVSIVIRYRDGLTSPMRVMIDGMPWDITGEPIALSPGLVRFEAVTGVRDGI